jgi:plasmid stabilization system protein ParE
MRASSVPPNSAECRSKREFADRLAAQSELADLANIIAFIAERSPTAARSLKATIESAVLPASDYPYLFRAGRVA